MSAGRSLAREPAGVPGFTTTELVVVILIVGILAAVAIPRVTGRSSFDTRGYADRTRSALAYAQGLAISRRHNVCVQVAAAAITVTTASAAGSTAGCDVAVNDPTTGASFAAATIPTGVALASTISPIVFDALGQNIDPSTGEHRTADITVTVTGDFTTTITVEKVTGHVH